MKLSDAFPSKYLSAADLDDKAIMAVIEDAQFVALNGEKKVVISFQGGKTPEGKMIFLKSMICNKTNFKTIAEILGSDDTKDWPGGEIVLITKMVEFGGELVPGLRVRAPRTANGGPRENKVPQPNSGYGIGLQHEVEDKGRYDTLRRTEPVKTTGDDLPEQEIPF